MKKYLRVFTSLRMLSTLLLGFSSGLPLALTGSTLQAWLTEAKVDTATIGRFALVGLPYAMKFLWAPLLDGYRLPFLGLRRGWLMVTQLGLLAATCGLAFVDPAQNLDVFSLMAFLLAFFSASQDIVIDAYRTEIVSEAEVGAGASTYITGYRLAMVVSGGVALVMADHASWTVVYLAMAVINLIGLATVLSSPEPKVTRKARSFNVKDSVISPFKEFFQRSGAMEILIFIMVYKLSTLMATALTTKFLLELGYSKTLIGSTNKVFGLIATILGTATGGALMAKFGLKRSLWFFGLAQSVVGLTFCLLSRLAGLDDGLKDIYLITVISLDNYMMGMGTAALTGFMMSFSNRQFTGTQYALLSSVMAVSRVILIAQAGTLVETLGWDWFFISTVPLAIPGLLMLSRFDHWQTTANHRPKISKFDLGLIALFVASLISLSSDPLWQWLGLKDEGLVAVTAGAAGIVAMVVLGLARPYLPFRFARLKAT